MVVGMSKMRTNPGRVGSGAPGVSARARGPMGHRDTVAADGALACRDCLRARLEATTVAAYLLQDGGAGLP